MSLDLVRSFWQPVFRRTLPTDGDPSAQGCSAAFSRLAPARWRGSGRLQKQNAEPQVADDALQTAAQSYRKFVAVLPPSSSRSGGSPGRRSSTQQTTGLHRTM